MFIPNYIDLINFEDLNRFDNFKLHILKNIVVMNE